MTLKARPTRGRLAPSPTGGLHLGHARTFLLAWLTARSQGGRVILRIEDLDATRTRAEAVDGAVEDLRWLGLHWDEGPDRGGPFGPYVQSERKDAYQDSLEVLKQAERVYPCTCTRAEIARFASAPHSEDEGPTYPGICAHRRATDAGSLGGRPFAWRFRVPEGPVDWEDLWLGRVEIDPSKVGGDFLVAREGVGPSYQLAVVHDDATMGVTQVVRGDDLAPSTPRQILLYRALGREVPEFGHVGLVLGPDGRRLAKRDGSIKLRALRDAGLAPEALVGWLARTLGQSGQGLTTPEQALQTFDPRAVPTGPHTIDATSMAHLLSGRTPP
ncbi:MAG: tRNA glutamyl-Q(34) synthetase GluQRS [Isosphaeraceae bacterium]